MNSINRKLVDKKMYHHEHYFLIFTHRPNGIYINKLYQTLCKRSTVEFISPTSKFTNDTVYLARLGKNLNTIFQVIKMFYKSILKIRKGIKIVDVIDSGFFPTFLERDIILLFSSPLHVEMKWHGYPNALIKYMKYAQDNLIRKAKYVIAYNEMMAEYCENKGASNVIICPNYPTKNFKPTTSKEKWLKLKNLPMNAKYAIYVAGGRMFEIYGLDLLLKAWSIVEKEINESYLIIVGPASRYQIEDYKRKLNISKIILTDSVMHSLLPNWINIADVCLAPRTQDFPSKWYNDKDSTKISEYAALRKPIVAAGYSPSSQYLLVDRTPEAFAEGIVKAYKGGVEPAEPHYWEENEEKILGALNLLVSQ